MKEHAKNQKRILGSDEDFVVLWIGEAADPDQALKQMRDISGEEPTDVYKVVGIAKEKELTTYSGFQNRLFTWII